MHPFSLGSSLFDFKCQICIQQVYSGCTDVFFVHFNVTYGYKVNNIELEFSDYELN